VSEGCRRVAVAVGEGRRRGRRPLLRPRVARGAIRRAPRPWCSGRAPPAC